MHIIITHNNKWTEIKLAAYISEQYKWTIISEQ